MGQRQTFPRPRGTKRGLCSRPQENRLCRRVPATRLRAGERGRWHTVCQEGTSPQLKPLGDKDSIRQERQLVCDKQRTRSPGSFALESLLEPGGFTPHLETGSFGGGDGSQVRLSPRWQPPAGQRRSHQLSLPKVKRGRFGTAAPLRGLPLSLRFLAVVLMQKLCLHRFLATPSQPVLGNAERGSHEELGTCRDPSAEGQQAAGDSSRCSTAPGIRVKPLNTLSLSSACRIKGCCTTQLCARCFSVTNTKPRDTATGAEGTRRGAGESRAHPNRHKPRPFC